MLKFTFSERRSVLFGTYLLLLLIAGFDYWSGSDISSSLLYLLPIYLIASHRRAGHWQAVSVAAISSLAWFGVEYQLQQKIGNEWIFYWNALVRAGVFFTIALTTSRLKQKQLQLEKANVELQQLNVQKNKYIGVAAHDMRSPIGNIYSLSDLLLTSGETRHMEGEPKKILQMIHQISFNALKLLDNLLDVTQIEAGTLRMKPERYDYVHFVREVVEAHAVLAAQKEQRLGMETTVDTLPLVFDQTYTGQVLTNLLTNAMKYSFPKTTIQVSIRLEGRYVKTEVRDQGLGIRKEDQSRIFEPFEKTQNVPTAGERSSGLGLAIVRKIVEAHGGELGLQSTYGKGSVFYYFLPLQPE